MSPRNRLLVAVVVLLLIAALAWLAMGASIPPQPTLATLATPATPPVVSEATKAPSAATMVPAERPAIISRITPGMIDSTIAAEDKKSADAVAPLPLKIAGRPAMVYKPEDRATILARIAPGKTSFTPTADDKSSPDPVKSLLASYRFEWHAESDLVTGTEERRSDLLMKLALLAWLDPEGEYPQPASAKKKTTYIDSIRSAISAVTVPQQRVKDFFTDQGGDQKKPGKWETYLKSSISLWCYALAYDQLSTPEVAAAGLKDEDLELFYKKLADGILHLQVAHLQSYMDPSQSWKDPKGPVGNNWNSREFSGVALALLSMGDRYSTEPATAERHADYAEGLPLIRQLFTTYLDGWGSPKRGDGPLVYYYEGPHYLRYWVEYGLALGVAWARAFPGDKFDLLQPDGPVARYCRTQTLWSVATGRKDGSPEWTCPPVDDTWTYPDEFYVPVMLGAAWIKYPAEERAAMVSSIKRCDIHIHPLLLANPILNEMNDGKPPAALPLVSGIQHDGVGIARSAGENEKTLTVVVKNFETPLDDKEAPALNGHTHSDNGEVLAYRNAEVVLVDPGYGPKGFGNKVINDTFTGWEHRNTLCVEDPPASGKFTLPIWKDYGPHDRLSRAENVKDDLGEMRVLEMTTPAHRRTVIMPSDSCLIIIDRLDDAKRVKLCWWGNGSVTGRENEGSKSGKPWEGDPAKIVTATVDVDKAEGVFFRGPSLAEKIQVIVPGEHTASEVVGEYGPKWYNTNYPLTGLHTISKDAVHYAVTLVELAPKTGKGAPSFKLTAQAAADDKGKLKSVTVSDGTKSVEYRIAADGKVERSGK